MKFQVTSIQPLLHKKTVLFSLSKKKKTKSAFRYFQSQTQFKGSLTKKFA